MFRAVLLSQAIACVCLVGNAACKPAPVVPAAATAPDVSKEIAALKAEIETLKGKSPSASVAMADVGFHWSNLWFAGRAGNWPLATFYFNEARNHVRWMTRINPNPKGPDGMPVDVKGIFDGIDTSTVAEVKTAIETKDAKAFESSSRGALESCYSCHKAVGRPYLRPTIPTSLPQTIITLDTSAKWPQ